MTAAATAPTTGAAAPSLSFVPRRAARHVHAVEVQVGRVRLPRLIPLARVVAVLQVVDERELDLVAGL